MQKVISINPYLVLFFLLILLSPLATTLGSIFSALIICFLAFYFYSLAAFLYQKLPQGHNISLQLFNINLLISTSYYLYMAVCYGRLSPISDTFKPFDWSFALIGPVIFL